MWSFGSFGCFNLFYIFQLHKSTLYARLLCGSRTSLVNLIRFAKRQRLRKFAVRKWQRFDMLNRNTLNRKTIFDYEKGIRFWRVLWCNFDELLLMDSRISWSQDGICSSYHSPVREFKWTKINLNEFHAYQRSSSQTSNLRIFESFCLINFSATFSSFTLFNEVSSLNLLETRFF